MRCGEAEHRGRARGEKGPAPLLMRIKELKMQNSQDHNTLQTSLLHEFITVSVESLILIMMVMLIVW